MLLDTIHHHLDIYLNNFNNHINVTLPGVLSLMDSSPPSYYQPSLHHTNAMINDIIYGVNAEPHLSYYTSSKLNSRRRKRQLMTPDFLALQSSYGNLFGAQKNRRKGQFNKRRQKIRDKSKSSQDDDMPIVLVPKDKQTDCVTNNQVSSFGFLGFILNVVNAVVNVANNINNNLDSNNNNDNNNNNNDGNTNQVMITNTANNNNPPVMAIAGRRIHRLKMMRDALNSHINNVEDYREKKQENLASSTGSSNQRKHRDSTESQSKPRRRREAGGDTCGFEEDVVDDALLGAVALMEMWNDLLHEHDPWCMALRMCETSYDLTKTSRVTGIMVDVASVAAANMLVNFQGVNKEFLLHAAEIGKEGDTCREYFADLC